MALHELNVLNASPLSCQGLNLVRLNLPQKEQFVSGIGVRKSREALVVEWIDGNGRISYGECSCRPDPYYSPEFLDAAIQLVRQFIFPQLAGVRTFGDLAPLFRRIRGWEFTKAAVEMAAYHAVLSDQPAARPHSPVVDGIPVGISMGIQTDPEVFARKVEDALQAGYQRLKFKISPRTDLELFERVRPALQTSDTYVSFDANGSYSAEDLDHLGYFVRHFPESALEQPFSPDNYADLLAGKRRFPELKICFDEEIRSLGDLIKLHRLGVLDEVNLKPGRVGGLVHSLEIMAYCKEHGIPCWVGGMFETGIGRIFNLGIAACLPEARAHDLSPSDRYFAEDVVAPGVQMQHGFVLRESLADCVVQPDIIQKYTTEKIELRP